MRIIGGSAAGTILKVPKGFDVRPTPDLVRQAIFNSLGPRVADAEVLEVVYRLLSEEGLCLGGSSGVNAAGAVRMARDLGPGHTIVTVLCDYGTRYQSKMFNPPFLREKGLPVPPWLEPQPALPDVSEQQ